MAGGRAVVLSAKKNAVCTATPQGCILSNCYRGLMHMNDMMWPVMMCQERCNPLQNPNECPVHRQLTC